MEVFKIVIPEIYENMKLSGFLLAI